MRRVLDDVGFGQELAAELDCGSYQPGVPLKCRIFNRPKQLANPTKSKSTIALDDKKFWVGFQFHGHVSNNKLTGKKVVFPKHYGVLQRKCASSCGAVEDFPEALPQFVTYDSDHGMCIMYSKPIVVEVAYLSESSELIDIHYTIDVPKFLVPTFPGKLVRYWYSLSVSVCPRPTTNPGEVNSVHLPVQIEWSNTLISLSKRALQNQIQKFGRDEHKKASLGVKIDLGILAVKSAPEYEVPIPTVYTGGRRKEKRMPPPASRQPLFLFNYRSELRNAGTFNISNNGVPVVSIFSNASKEMSPLGFLYFDCTFDRTKYICHHLCAGLQWAEKVVDCSNAHQSDETFSFTSMECAEAFHDVTRDKLNLSFNLQVPAFAMTFSTDLISVTWQVIFELSLKPIADADADKQHRGVNYDKLQWVLPIKVSPKYNEENDQLATEENQ